MPSDTILALLTKLKNTNAMLYKMYRQHIDLSDNELIMLEGEAPLSIRAIALQIKTNQDYIHLLELQIRSEGVK